MDLRQGFIGTIGNTPLIRLGRLSAETGCEILGKAEFMNPGGSVKDRAAAALVADAKETFACAYLSFTLLLGLALNAAWGWWWADPVAAFLMIPFLVREGWEAIEQARGDQS